MLRLTDKEFLEYVKYMHSNYGIDLSKKRVLIEGRLSNIVNKKTGIDFGTIMDLIPQKRGPSGRILELLIVGERESAVIGKELEIRRALSESHLLSSAFVVEKESDNNGNTATFRLIGAGWGHGVGLCQIGAAIMGTKGYSYKDILGHYYPGTIIRRYY